MTSGFLKETVRFQWNLCSTKSFQEALKFLMQHKHVLMKWMVFVKWSLYLHGMIKLYDHLYLIEPLCFQSPYIRVYYKTETDFHPRVVYDQILLWCIVVESIPL